MSIIYSLVYFRIENNQEGIQNVNGVLFICLMNCAFGTLFCVLNVRLYQRLKNRLNLLYISLFLLFLDFPSRNSAFCS